MNSHPHLGGRADLDRVLFGSDGFLVSPRRVPTDGHLFYPLDFRYVLFCLNQLNSSPFPWFFQGEFLEEPERMGGVPESGKLPVFLDSLTRLPFTHSALEDP